MIAFGLHTISILLGVVLLFLIKASDKLGKDFSPSYWWADNRWRLALALLICIVLEAIATLEPAAIQKLFGFFGMTIDFDQGNAHSVLGFLAAGLVYESSKKEFKLIKDQQPAAIEADLQTNEVEEPPVAGL